uniref:Uncharacterized protein n=1 Tax=Oryza punctata TaxID=4537 RepID=A0A0E0MGG4_ORYPU
MATDSAGIQMPQVLRAPIRPDVVTFTHKLLSCNRRQPYAVSRRARHQTSADEQRRQRVDVLMLACRD